MVQKQTKAYETLRPDALAARTWKRVWVAKVAMNSIMDKRMKKPIVVVATLTLLVAIGASSYYYFLGTPTYSLYQLGKAIKSHDSATFNRYVDVDRVVDGLFATATEEIDKEAESISESDSGMFAELGKSIAMMFAGSMKTAIKENINRSIEEISSGEDSKIASFGIKEIQREGKAAKAILENAQKETIEVSMIQADQRYWRIVGVNFDDFKKINPDAVDAKKVAEEQERKAEEEKKAKEEDENRKYDVLRSIVSVEVMEKTFAPSDYMKGVYDDFIVMKLKLTNHSGRTIKGFQGKLSFSDMFDDKISSSPFKYEKLIQPGESVEYLASKSYNMFMEEDKRLKDADLKDMKLEWLPETVLYEDGTKETKN